MNYVNYLMWFNDKNFEDIGPDLILPGIPLLKFTC